MKPSKFEFTDTHKYQLLTCDPISPPPIEEGLSFENVALPEPSRDTLRPEIQGLRAIAIGGVLLFHVWSSRFSAGYLGVDVFFVISGYLMIMLLSRKQKSITFTDTLDFYYRRIKRIVPTYIFVIVCTLIACYTLISAFDFGQLIQEAIPSLLFYSNFPSVHEHDYFDVRSKYEFLLHTWSLSTELQFYLFVPALVFVVGLLANTRPICALLFISLIAIASFTRQTIASSASNAKHMALDGRIWQFLAGFLAHFAYQAKVFDLSALESKSGDSNRIFRSILAAFVSLVPTCGLVLLLSLDITALMGHQIQRLLVVALTAFIISIRSLRSEWLLSSDALVNLGNVSYSVYLVHWPILTMHRYIDPDVYEDGREAGHIVGSYLIGLSILLGYAIEKAFKRILAFVRGWRSLMLLTLVLYLIAGLTLYHLNRDAQKLVEDEPLTKKGEEQRLQDTLMLWRTRKNGKPFSIDQTIAYNKEIAYFSETCHNKNRTLPSRFTDFSDFAKICHESGSGTKNVLVFGNSHAYKPFIGIAQLFKPVAREITLISTPACVPGFLEEQHPSIGKARAKKCEKFLADGVHAMQQWEHPLHIIIVLFGWDGYKDTPETDLPKVAGPMQAFFGNVSQAAEEVMLMPLMNLLWPKSPLRVVQEKLKSGQAIERIGERRKKLAAYVPNIRRQLENVKCEKCVKMNWLDLWCGKEEDAFCHGVEPKRNLAYFYDNNHCTTYGAMFIADFLLGAYKNYAKSHH